MTTDSPHTTVVRSDEPISIHVGDAGDGHWFRLFNTVVDGGTWAKLSPSTKAVLVVLARNVNNEIRKSSGEWLTWPSITTIMRLAGTQRRATYNAIAELERFRLLVKRTSGGGKAPTTYQLTGPRVHVDAPKEDRMKKTEATTTTLMLMMAKLPRL